MKWRMAFFINEVNLFPLYKCFYIKTYQQITKNACYFVFNELSNFLGTLYCLVKLGNF